MIARCFFKHLPLLFQCTL